MITIDIGTKVDLDKLIESRLLIQASSGGGKSYQLRVLAEQILPHMPVFILDWEGEFASLREKFDMVLVGPGGDAPCDVKSAKLMAHSLIHLGVSAIIDMSELKTYQRQDYVADFLDALVHLPRKEWPSAHGKAVAVLVDEAHKLCPQKERSVASTAVIDLQSLGRKRGLCGILATQRLSKLNKDAAAECNNILVGRCSSIDSAKACEELGLGPSNKHELTQLPVGAWRAVGPAFDAGLQAFKGAKAQTSHAKTGKKLLKPPAPSAKIKKVLPMLKAVQKTKADEAEDMVQARKQIRTLKGQLTKLEKSGPKAEPITRTVVDRNAVDGAVVKAVRKRDREWNIQLNGANKTIKDLWRRLFTIRKAANDNAIGDAGQDISKLAAPPPEYVHFQKATKYQPPSVTTGRTQCATPNKSATPSSVTLPEGLTSRHQKLLDSLAWWANVGVSAPNKALIAVMSGYKVSGNFRNLLGRLNQDGYIYYSGNGSASLTNEGKALAKAPDNLCTLDDLHKAWRDRLEPRQVKLLNVIIENGQGGEMTVEELADRTEYRVSGNFRNLLGKLRSYGLVEKRGPIKPTDLLFPEGLV